MQKALGGTGRIAAADQFSLSGTGTGAPAAVTTTGATTAVTSAAYSISATAGSAYSLTEAMAAGSASTLAQYSQAVSCSNTGPTVVTGLTSLPINVTPVAGDAIVCTVTNTPRPAVITFTKSTAVTSVTAGTVIPYTLTLTNSGGSSQAVGHVFYEVVPAHTTFTSVGGSVSSNCAAGAVAGTLCTLTTTAPVAAGGGTLAVTFTVTAVSPIPAGVTSIANALYSAPPPICVGSACPPPVCPDPLAAACVTTPVEPDAPLFLVKTANKAEAEIGDTVRYQLTIKSPSGRLQRGIVITDRLPAGFRYIAGTTLLNGVTAADPEGGVGPVLRFAVGNLPRAGAGANSIESVVTYTVRVGVGAQQGDGINRARGRSLTGVQSNEARASVRVMGGVFTTQACVAGKVFVDCNNNHVQDAEELGIPGVRLYLEDGTWFITDPDGKYSYCGLKPTTHGLKVDPFTLPHGSRITTTSSRNLGDGNSLFLDTKNGELVRGDFAEGSCSNRVIEQVKARRVQGEVRSPENETPNTGLSFKSKAPGAAR